jgi:hypothetical protein
VHLFAHDFLMDAKGNFFPSKNGKGNPPGAAKGHSAGSAKEKEERD